MSEPEEIGKIMPTILAQMKVLELHTRALACHCECLGMNAENCQCACLGQPIAYADHDFLMVMEKWGLQVEDVNCITDGKTR